MKDNAAGNVEPATWRAAAASVLQSCAWPLAQRLSWSMGASVDVTRSIAEDSVQGAIELTLRGRCAWDGTYDLERHLCQVAKRLLRWWARKKSNSSMRRFPVDAEGAVIDPLPDNDDAWESTPEAQLLREEQRRHEQKALEAILEAADDEAAARLEHIMDGLSVDESAARLGVDRGQIYNINKRLMRLARRAGDRAGEEA